MHKVTEKSIGATIEWFTWMIDQIDVSFFYNVALSELALILSLNFFYLAVLNHLAVFCFQTTSKKRGPSINSSVKRSSNNQPFSPSFSLANICGKNKERNKNRKQKEISEKSGGENCVRSLLSTNESHIIHFVPA